MTEYVVSHNSRKISNKKVLQPVRSQHFAFYSHFVVLSTFFDTNIILLLVISLLKTPQRKVYKKKAVKTVLYTSHLTVIFRIIRHLSTFLLNPLISKYFLTFFRPFGIISHSQNHLQSLHTENLPLAAFLAYFDIKTARILPPAVHFFHIQLFCCWKHRCLQLTSFGFRQLIRPRMILFHFYSYRHRFSIAVLINALLHAFR